MKLHSTPILLLSALFLLLLGSPALSAPVQDLESLETSFRSAASSRDASKRTAALDALIALGDPAAVASLRFEYAKVSPEGP